ncbi:MAG: hypothetical protein VX278_05365 [Myxococcota bacterium]|nr:hypothetical protein [Myxococcota bacterium]
MASKKKTHRAGGKFCGPHTTIIPCAGSILDEWVKCDSIKKISLGLIVNNRSSTGSPLRVRCKELGQGVLGFHIKISKGGETQTVRLFLNPASDTQSLRDYIESFSDTQAGKRGKSVRKARKRHTNR